MQQTKHEIKPITGYAPVGSLVAVELLTAQETANTKLFVTGAEADVSQGIVMALGPMVPEKYGVKVGDRVWFHGIFHHGPAAIMQGRGRGCVDFTTIKGILKTDEDPASTSVLLA